MLPLFVDYGQPARILEWNAVTAIAASVAGAAVRLTVSPGVYPAHPAYGLLPVRNLLLLAVALAYGGSRGIRIVAIGSNADDAQRGDGSATFRAAVGQVASITPPRVRLIAPLASLTKPAVVARGRALGAPVHATISCYTSAIGGCRACRGCYDRQVALASGTEVER